MKNIVLLLLLMFTVSIFSSLYIDNSPPPKSKITMLEYSDFCEGFEDGYCEGWKDVKGQYSVCPVAPVCPVPEAGQNDYRGGYNKGFKRGMRDAEKD